MKTKKILGVFLVLLLLAPAILLAEAPSTSSLQTTGEQAGLPEVKTYDELRHAISQARAESRLRVEKAAEQERVREAWEIGRLIDAHVLQHKDRADYAEHVLERLAGDLGMSRTELYYMLEFARTYPIIPLTGQLSWSHYRDLLSVNDPKERESIAEQAAKNKWTQKEIRQAVRKAKGIREEDSGSEEQSPPSTPGKPGTYRVILAKAGPYAGQLAIDLGFSNYYLPPGQFSFKEGEIITSAKDAGGNYSFRSVPSPNPLPGGEDTGEGVSDLLYTYEAYVYEVLDGDTVNAVVDLGFGFVTTQTLRLRGIDAPEIVTADGMEAKEFLESVLANPAGVKQSQDNGIAASSRQPAELLAMTTKPPILIKTVKSDKYDRYLADIFVDGVYVNQKLVDDELAVLVEE